MRRYGKRCPDLKQENWGGVEGSRPSRYLCYDALEPGASKCVTPLSPKLHDASKKEAALECVTDLCSYGTTRSDMIRRNIDDGDSYVNRTVPYARTVSG